jgi:curved DNA-binding protein
VEAQVPLVTAVLGGEVEVATLKEKIALKVAPETQNGQVMRLSGLGMPKLNDPAKRGDLYVKVKVVLPGRLTDEQRRLFEELRDSGT